MFHQCADDQRQTLLSPGKTMERSVSRTFINAENIQPLLHQFLLAIRNGLINANRIKIARKNHITNGRADPVTQMQTTADVTEIIFDIPNRSAAAATCAETRTMVAGTCRMT